MKEPVLVAPYAEQCLREILEDIDKTETDIERRYICANYALVDILCLLGYDEVITTVYKKCIEDFMKSRKEKNESKRVN